MPELKCSFITHNGNNRKSANLADKLVDGDNIGSSKPDIIFVSEQEGYRDKAQSLSKKLKTALASKYTCLEFLSFDTRTKLKGSGKGAQRVTVFVRKDSNFTIRKLDSFDLRDSSNNNKGIQTVTLGVKQKNCETSAEKVLHLSGGHLDSFSAEGRYFQGIANERRKKQPGDIDVFIGDSNERISYDTKRSAIDDDETVFQSKQGLAYKAHFPEAKTTYYPSNDRGKLDTLDEDREGNKQRCGVMDGAFIRTVADDYTVTKITPYHYRQRGDKNSDDTGFLDNKHKKGPKGNPDHDAVELDVTFTLDFQSSINRNRSIAESNYRDLQAVLARVNKIFVAGVTTKLPENNHYESYNYFLQQMRLNLLWIEHFSKHPALENNQEDVTSLLIAWKKLYQCGVNFIDGTNSRSKENFQHFRQSVEDFENAYKQCVKHYCKHYRTFTYYLPPFGRQWAKGGIKVYRPEERLLRGVKAFCLSPFTHLELKDPVNRWWHTKWLWRLMTVVGTASVPTLAKLSFITLPLVFTPAVTIVLATVLTFIVATVVCSLFYHLYQKANAAYHKKSPQNYDQTRELLLKEKNIETVKEKLSGNNNPNYSEKLIKQRRNSFDNGNYSVRVINDVGNEPNKKRSKSFDSGYSPALLNNCGDGNFASPDVVKHKNSLVAT